jgi:VanZ family protein
MRSLTASLGLLVLVAAIVIAIGMSLPLVRELYERSIFLWVSLASAVGLGALLVIAPFRAQTPVKRRLFFFGLVAVVAAVQVIRIYQDRGSPSLLTASPEVLAFFRELVHFVEYGSLAFLATRLLQKEVGGILLYLTVFAYGFIVGIADETVQWLHAFRVGDLRDVVTNGVSVSLGLLYRAGLEPAPPPRTTPAGRALALVLLGLCPLVFFQFYLRTQTGHRICDERQNCFHSNYTEKELAETAEDRTNRWVGLPPGSLARDRPRFWAWEDYFLTEAKAHFRLAVDAANVNDWNTACAELRILTTRFAPAIPVIGIRLQDYPCQGLEPEGFRSQVFDHLLIDADPTKWRAPAALAGLALLVSGAVLSRPRRNR